MAIFKGRQLGPAAAAMGAVLMLGTSAIASGTGIPQSPAASPAATAIGQSVDGGICPADLPASINRILSRPEFATAQWGIAIESLAGGAPLYTHQADTWLIPASNVKLLTTAAALRIIAERSPRALPSYRDQLDVINRHSNNYRADELLRTIGGQLAVNQALAPLGVNPTDYYQVDGSGLSRSNKAKPSTFVRLLKAMYTADTSGIFYGSLPVGGVNGTLRNRFKASPLQGKIHAKTGTLRGVRALSGYVETPDFGTVAFSIVINQPGQSGRLMLQAIDDMVLQIARVQPCR